MPIYSYTCTHCSYSYEVYKSMSQIETPEICPQCQAVSDRVLSTSGGGRPFIPYLSDNLSPFDDRPIRVESSSHKRQLEKDRNVVPWWPGQGKKGCWI